MASNVTKQGTSEDFMLISFKKLLLCLEPLITTALLKKSNKRLERIILSNIALVTLKWIRKVSFDSKYSLIKISSRWEKITWEASRMHLNMEARTVHPMCDETS